MRFDAHKIFVDDDRRFDAHKMLVDDDRLPIGYSLPDF